MVKGFEDRETPRTESPTCTRENLRVALAIASSFGWECYSVDIKAAFLQEKTIDREVYLQPPTEAKALNKLWKWKKMCYCLCDASRVWYLRAKDRLLELGVVMSKYDNAMFY